MSCEMNGKMNQEFFIADHSGTSDEGTPATLGHHLFAK
jgi:hypothetical protein